MGYLFQVVFVCFLAVTLSSGADQCKNGAKCIDLKECAGLYHQLSENNNLLLRNLLKNLHCGFHVNEPKVCCPPEYHSQSELNSKAGYADNNDLLPSSDACGIQNDERIVGGTQTYIDEHPWMALLRYDKPNGHGYYCGGVIISKRYILTAAHCVKGADLPPTWKLSQVRLGEWNVTSKQDCQRGDCSPDVIDIPIEEAIAHESYSAKDSNQHNDIALLRLARDIKFTTDFVKPICLPTSSDLMQSSFENYDMEVAGWGKTESRSSSDVKLKVRLPIVNRKKCQDVYKVTNRVISDRQICAGGLDGQDSCRGDSGGPLMGRAVSSKNWIVAGVVSYGPSPCGSAGWPGVYTKVTSYIDWIKSKIRS